MELVPCPLTPAGSSHPSNARGWLAGGFLLSAFGAMNCVLEQKRKIIDFDPLSGSLARRRPGWLVVFSEQ
jgi:hypothetical protein